MAILEFCQIHSSFFWILALVISLYYAIRGIFIQRHQVANENRENRANGMREWSPSDIGIVHCGQDFIYNFVGSLAGWVALDVLLGRLLAGASGTPPTSQVMPIPLGWPELVLSAVAFLGVAGKLPQTVEKGILSIGRVIENLTSKVSPSGSPDQPRR